MTSEPANAGRPRALVFSRDRPLQLDGTLRSLASSIPAGSLERVDVIYRATTPFFAALYRQLRREHPLVCLIEEQDFQADVRSRVAGARYVMFLVDDAVFTRAFDPAAVVAALAARPDAIGFSLRLGRNTTYCYPMDRPQALPGFGSAGEGILAFHWPGQVDDFGYPLEISSSVYGSDVIGPLVESLVFQNPNSLEAALSRAAPRYAAQLPTLLCFETSAAFCIPSNVVQTAQRPNRSGLRQEESALALGQAFDRGARLDIESYRGFTSIGCHQDVPLKVVHGADLPTVSIVTPCHGQAEYLPELAGSVLAQTFEDWELIIVDDGSPDDAAAVAARLTEENPDRRIRLLRQANLGVSEARNTGVRAASGRFILPLDADDQIEPTMLEQLVDLLDSHPEIAIAYTDVQEFGARTRSVRASEFDLDRLVSVNQISHCALYRREVWEATGGYDAAMEPGYEDWDFWIGAGERGYRAMRVPGFLFRYRVKDESRQKVAEAHDIELRRLIRTRHPGLFDVRHRVRRRIRFTFERLIGRWL